MIHIFVPQISERIRYIFHTIFNERLAIAYTLYDNIDSFYAIDGKYKIAYANEYVHNALFIEASPLLLKLLLKISTFALVG